MAVHIDILAELEQRSVRKAADQLDRTFRDMSVNVGADVKAAEIKAAAAKLQREFSDIRAEIKVDIDRGAIARVGQVTRVLDGVTTGLTNIASGAAQAHQNLMTLGTTMMKTTRGLGALAAVPATITLIDFAKVAATASQSLLLLPAAATAAGAGIGTLAIATHGFSDAIKDMGDPKKFAEDLQLLSPAAQQAALSVQAMLPRLRELKNATQDAFFADFGGQGGIFEQLADTYLPSVEKMTTGIAGAFNQMMKDVSADLMTPETQGQINNIMTNITAAFQNATPAVKSFVDAFLDITEVGSEFLPSLGTNIAVAAQKFADFISEAKESGKLKEWIQEGIDAVKSLADGIVELVKAGKELYDFFTSGSGVDDFRNDMEGLHTIMATLSGDFHVFGTDIRSEFESLSEGWLRNFVNFWLDIPEAMATGLNKGIDVFNGFIDKINNATKDSILGKIFDLIPGGPTSDSLNIPHVGHVPIAGDWGELAGPPIFGPPGSGATAAGAAPPGGPRGQPNRTTLPTPGGPGLPGPTGDRPVPGVPPGGPKASDRERRDAIIAGLDPALYHVDPYAPIPGLPGVPAPGGPGGKIDPAAIQEAQFNLESKAHDLQESIKNRLALERDNEATAEQISDAKWKEHQNQIDLWKAQQNLLEKQHGTAEKFTQSMDEFGAKLDQDFGISKGLPGIAENITKFLANLAFAPMFGKLSAISQADEQATGIKGGYGLMGMLGAQNLAAGRSPLGLQQMATGGSTGLSQYSPSAMEPARLGGLAQQFGTRQPYGLPSGTNTGGYGTGTGSTFPPWVMAVADAFGIKPSTYAGHQESDRNEAGYAPNPQHQNRGIDWTGATEDLQRFANYLGTIPSALEQVIWQNPNTGQKTGIAGGQINPGYYPQSTYDEHGGNDPKNIHVHTRQSQSIPLPGGGGGPNWNAIMGAEAGGSGGWQANTGNGFYGGLQFTPSSWASAKPPGAPGRADLATPEQQIAAGNTLLGMQGPGAWPATSAAHPEWFQTTGGPTSLPTLPAGFGGTGAPLGLGPPPLSPGAGAPGGMGPGLGGAAGLGLGPQPGLGSAAGQTPIGGVEPYSNPGGGNFGITPGGSIDTALGVAASMFPGVGQAAATGMKLASRAIQYGGQVAGISAQGWMDTLLPTGGSQLASNNWLTRIAGGIAGASAAIPNIAGGLGQKEQGNNTGPQPLAPGDVSTGQGQGPAPGPGNKIDVTYNNNGATEDRAGKDLTANLGAMYMPPGRR